MATKQVDPNDPGQLQLYATDLIVAAASLTPYQLKLYVLALQYEWQAGYAPQGIVWTRFERAVNQHQKSEIKDLSDRYEALPLTAKMRDQRIGKLRTRLNKIAGANRAVEAAATQLGNQLPTQLGNSSALQDNTSAINKDALENAGNYPPSSSSSSSSSSQDKENNKGDKSKAVSVAPTMRLVFAYWQLALSHPDAKLTAKRERVITNRLKEGYTLEQLKLAIDGCKASPFHQGQNKNATVYDDLELICRDGGQVEKFIAIANQPPAVTVQARSPNSWQQSKTAGNEAAAEEAIRRMEARLNASGTDETVYQIADNVG